MSAPIPSESPGPPRSSRDQVVRAVAATVTSAAAVATKHPDVAMVALSFSALAAFFREGPSTARNWIDTLDYWRMRPSRPSASDAGNDDEA